MRDAFGGAFLIKVMLIFLAIYIIFMGVALNYAKAFRVKNQIINIIEQSEGIDEVKEEDVRKQVSNYLSEIGYHYDFSSKKNYRDDVNCYSEGYCIYPNERTDKGKYYLVKTFVVLEFPFFNISVDVPISGETKVIERVFTGG